MMDMRALKVGQHVILSGALPSAGNVGEVTYAGKYVAVAVAAQIDGEDGRYGMTFHNDGNLSLFYGWYSANENREPWCEKCPIPELKIIGVKEVAA
jgi:hypothetical protein